MMKSYRSDFKRYLADLGMKKPSPGGGSAVCIISCLGFSLIEKALRYSAGRDKSFVKELNALKKLRTDTAIFIDLDGKIFSQIMKSSGKSRIKLIKKSEEIVVNTGLGCVKGFSLAKKVESGIKKSIISDFRIGIGCLNLALQGCLLNLEANKLIFRKESRYISVFGECLEKWEKF